MNEWRESDWQGVSKPAFLGVLGAVILLAMFYANSFTQYLPIIDHVNLAFHETGHLVYGLFGQWMGILGGTLGQLTMPLIVMIAFWRKGHTASFAIAGIWFFQNFFNIARYMADARARELPLVGGGDHDWTNLLFHWNLLHQDTLLAGYVEIAGWLGIIGVLAWLGWHAFLRESWR